MKQLTTYISTFIDFINNVLVPLVFALAFIAFIFGVFRYLIAGAGNPEKRKTGGEIIVYSVIGFAVMISVWGIVNLVVNTFGFDSNTRPCLPTFGGNCSATSGGTTDSPKSIEDSKLRETDGAGSDEPKEREDGALPAIY